MLVCNGNERKTLIFMEEKGSRDEDADDDDEGDDSDVEEISEETFNQEARPKPKHRQDSRVCVQNQDVVGNFSSSYSYSLHCHASSQGVESKPLNEIVVEDSDSDDEPKRPSHELLVSGRGDGNRSLNSSKFVCTVIIDDSSEEESDGGIREEVGSGLKDEGEVKEQEIVEKADEEEEISSNARLESDWKVKGFDKLVQSLREALDSINAEEAEKDFHRVCKMVWCCLERFKLLQLQEEYPIQAIEALVPLAFKGIQTVNSVFVSMTAPQKEQFRAFLSSMLDYAMGLKFGLFPLEQRRKIWAMKRSIDAKSVSLTGEGICQEKDKLACSGANLNQIGRLGETAAVQSVSSSQNNAEPMSVDTGVRSNENMDYESLRLGNGSRTFSPIFDIHRGHDVDSLPSPTRDTSQPLPVQNTLDVRDSIVKLKLAHRELAEKLEDGTTCISGTDSLNDNYDLPRNYDLDSCPSSPRESLSPLLVQKPSVCGDVKDMMNLSFSKNEVDIHTCETNALKAASSYQQKLGQTSFLSRNQLPSPTPSEECNVGVDDSSAEISSSYLACSVETVSPPILQLTRCAGSSPHGDDMSGRKLDVMQNTEQSNSGLSSAIRAPAKSRDPRLQFAHLDVAGPDITHDTPSARTGQVRGRNLGSRKHNILPSSVLDDRNLKKQRNGSGPEVSIDAQMALEDSCVAVHKPVETVGRSQQTENMETDLRKEDIIVRQQSDRANVSLAAPLDVSQQQSDQELKNLADILCVSQSVNNTDPSVLQSVSSKPISVEIDKEVVNFVRARSRDRQSVPSSIPERSAGHQSQSLWRDAEHLLNGYDDEQLATIHRERARRIEEQKKMFAARKLCLVLDLDHTLLNSAKFVEVEPAHHEILKKREEQDREMSHRHLFRLSHMGMWTKLRPGIWNFLHKASKLYELHVYTMGNNAYATQMAKILDPTGVLFAGRVISKGDEGEYFHGNELVPKSKDLDGVLGMESAVLIIDDSVKVWPHNKLNLIAVERYIYFPCSRRQFGLVGPSLLEIGRDESSDDGTLASSLAVIERIHQNFFQNQSSLDDLDVRNILALEKRKILAGCHILFSRIFPVDEAKPQRHPLWQTAEQFGAVCTNQIDEQVTHVVAISLGTNKVNWAQSTRRFVVRPGWLEASALLYRRANELDFALKRKWEPFTEWLERLAVLIGIAKAVHFLRTGVIPGFVNNRLKANNILLDEHGVAKLSDYGLSIITKEIDTHEAKKECNKSWQMTKLEDDVYCFGLVLLEMLVGPSKAGKGESFLLNEMASL